MKKPRRLSRKGGGRSKQPRSTSLNNRSEIVQVQDDASRNNEERPLQDLSDWWRSAVADGLAQHQEAMEWWGEFSRCCADAECGPRKVRVLCERLNSTMLATAEAASRLVFDQHRTATDLFRESQRFPKMGSPAEAQVAVVGVLSGATEMARAWGMIPVASQARTASAWAEFWALPPAGELGS